MRIPKVGAVVLALVLVVSGAGVGAYATVAAAAPKVVGVCANKTNGGYLRMLEAKNLPKSQYGKCRATEVKVSLPTSLQQGARGATGAAGRGLDGAPFKMTTTGNGPWSCSWVAATSTLACVTPTP